MRSDQLSLAELLAALSLATDVADGFPYEKALRTCLLAMRLADAHGVDDATRPHVYYAALLRYIGCTAFAHEEASVYGGGDDIQLRRTMADVDSARPADLVRKVATGVGKGTGPLRRPRAVATMLTRPSAPQRHAAAQSEAAVRLAELLAMPHDVVDAMEQVCERWDGKGGPSHVEGEGLTPVARIVHVADLAETTHHRHGLETAIAEVKARRDTHLDPSVVDTFLAAPADHLAGLDGPSVWEEVLDAEPDPRHYIPTSRLEHLGVAFARYVDLKSVWTLDHSQGVGRLAAAAGKETGLAADELTRLKVAALLHDVGRVGVPNGVWDKPGPLNRAERERVISHSFLGERILAPSPVLREIASVAAADHERLDGGGYHKGVAGAALGFPARLLAAADRFHAITEPRPHRPARSPAEATALLHEAVRSGEVDPDAADAVIAAAGASAPPAPRANPFDLTDREVEVLVLVARGASNKDIAGQLGISPRTVQHHVAHVYGKVGCSSRAGAALAAMQAGVVRA